MLNPLFCYFKRDNAWGIVLSERAWKHHLEAFFWTPPSENIVYSYAGTWVAWGFLSGQKKRWWPWPRSFPKGLLVSCYTYEQRHFYANKAETEVRHFCLQRYKTRCTPVERDAVGTKMIADPDKCFQELISEKLLILIAGWALAGVDYRFQSFSGFALLAGQVAGIGPKAVNSRKKVSKLLYPAFPELNQWIFFCADRRNPGLKVQGMVRASRTRSERDQNEDASLHNLRPLRDNKTG